MKKIILSNCFVLLISFCFAQTQLELNDQAQKKFMKSEKELNGVYNKIIKEYKTDTAFIINLRKAQKLWLQLREAEMKVKYPDREPGYYGSIQPMCWAIYKEELTRKRINELNIWLKDAEEGDSCSGTIKIKTQ